MQLREEKKEKEKKLLVREGIMIRAKKKDKKDKDKVRIGLEGAQEESAEGGRRQTPGEIRIQNGDKIMLLEDMFAYCILDRYCFT